MAEYPIYTTVIGESDTRTRLQFNSYQGSNVQGDQNQQQPIPHEYWDIQHPSSSNNADGWNVPSTSTGNGLHHWSEQQYAYSNEPERFNVSAHPMPMTHNTEPSTHYSGFVGTPSDVQRGPFQVLPRHPREGWPAWRWPILQVIIALGGIVFGYDVSNFANIQAPIYEAFGHVELLPWAAIAFTVATVTIAPLISRFLPILNLRLQLILYGVILILGSVVQGTASSLNAVIVGRAIAGIGGAGSYQSWLACNIRFATATELPRMTGLLGMSWALGLILGPIVGGAFATDIHATWRWAIYINLPVLAVLITLYGLVIPPVELVPGVAIIDHARRIDWVGNILHVSSFTLLISALVNSGSIWPWQEGSAIAAWTFVGLLYISFGIQQYFSVFTESANRVLPCDLLKIRVVALISLSTMMVGATYGITLYYTPLFFAFTRGYSPIDAAVRLLPFIGTFIVFTLLSGGLLPVVKLYGPFYTLGGLAIAIGAGLQTQLTVLTSQSAVMGKEALIGAGMGMMWQTGVAIIARNVLPDRKLDGTMLFIVMQLGGTSLSLGVAGALYENLGFRYMQSAIGGYGFDSADIRQALAGVDSRIFNDDQHEVSLLAVEAVTRVLAQIQFIPMVAGLVAMVCGVLMGWKQLEFARGGDTEQVAEQLEMSEVAGERPYVKSNSP